MTEAWTLVALTHLNSSAHATGQLLDRFQVYTEDLHVILKLFFSVCRNSFLSQVYLNDSVHKTQATLTGAWASNSQRLICSAFGGLGCILLKATVFFMSLNRVSRLNGELSTPISLFLQTHSNLLCLLNLDPVVRKILDILIHFSLSNLVIASIFWQLWSSIQHYRWEKFMWHLLCLHESL